MVKKQARFCFMIAIFIIYATLKGYQITFGDASRMDGKGHKDNSFHYKRLAIDLNLFKDDIYLEYTEDHRPLGTFWEFLGGTWGGRFNGGGENGDGNHYSWGE
jgi:hypothetical protein